MSVIDQLIKKIANSAMVIHKQQVAANAYHVTIQGESLRNLNYIPGQHLRIFVGVNYDTMLKDKIRTYSIWNYDRTNHTIDMNICTYSNGPGAEWIKNLEVGQTVYFKGPEGKFTADSRGDFYVFIGDVSALAHLYEIRRNIDIHKEIVSLIYSANKNEIFPDLSHDFPFEFAEISANPAEQIITYLNTHLSNVSGKGIAYIAGDGKICVELNKYFKKELNWNSKQIKVKPFWMYGKKGLE